MASTQQRSPGRVPVTRDRVLFTAIAIADEFGVEALTMRRLAEQLGAGVMSLYYHVPNKEAVLGGVVDFVFDEVEQAVRSVSSPAADHEWKAAVRARILASRTVLLRHPWAASLIETRESIGLAQARYLDSLVGMMHTGGLSSDLIHHAMHALGSRAYGFTTESVEPEGGASGSIALLEQMAEHVPNLVRMLSEVAHDEPTSTLGWCDDQFEFEFGLDLLLDGLDRKRRMEGA